MNDNPIASSTISVQMAYENYLNQKYVVNRKYQRKLVWTIEEKSAFIDSLSKWYFVPLFLFASKEEQGVIQYEIIDGMQRLNAIMSFVENEYPLFYNGQEGYFVNTLSSTKSLFDQGILKQQQPILDRQVCVNITNYPLPYSIINADTKCIEAIFRRINSFGKQLSNQEIRQAGAVGAFPNLVRKISSDIRHDVSPTDQVILNKMKEISLSNKRLKYGIVMEETFLVKQKIVTVPNMRVSRDEELVAWILSYMILGTQVEPSSKALDCLYQYEEDVDNKLSELMEVAIIHLGENTIISWFRNVHAEILQILKLANKSFRNLVYSEAYSEGLVRTYQVVFLAFFELLIKKYYEGSGDKLQNEIMSAIKKAPVEENVKMEIMTNFKMAKYGDYDIVVFELSSHDKPVLFNDTIYVRNGNQTKPVSGVTAMLSFYKDVFGIDYKQ